MLSDLSHSEKIARTKTRKSIEKNIPEDLLSQQFIKDQINEYMIFYDIMCKINRNISLSSEFNNLTMDLLKEKRQITKEMRNIIDFLSIYKNNKSNKKTEPENDEITL